MDQLPRQVKEIWERLKDSPLRQLMTLLTILRTDINSYTDEEESKDSKENKSRRCKN